MVQDKEMQENRIQERAVHLTTAEALAAKDLWSEIFYEDTAVFTDYYFAEKMADNIGYGIKKNGRLLSMLYLTPYLGQLYVPGVGGDDFLDVPLSYIVGVGTKKEYRHRGYMDRLLKTALTELCKLSQPFTFLMPADPAIYSPYQFCYIYDRPEFTVRMPSGASPMQTEDAQVLAAFAQQELKKHYQLFLKRDEAYYLRQQKESRAQNGDIYLWKEKEQIRGFYLYAQEAKAWIQEAVADETGMKEGLLQISEKKQPIIMARITNVSAMLSLLRLKVLAAMESIRLVLRVHDPLIQDNNATFLWTVGKKASTIALLRSDAADTGAFDADIFSLTAFIFGRKSARDCFTLTTEQEQAGLYEMLEAIEPVSRIFLNEIV